MKILIISDMVGGPGGAFKTIEQIDKFMPARIEIHVALDSIAKEYIQNNYHLRSVDFIPLSYKFHSEQTIINEIKNQLAKYKPNVVHIFNGSIKSNLLIRKFLVSQKIPFVTTESLIDSSLKLAENLVQDLREINANTNHVIYVSKANSVIAQKVFSVYPKDYSVIANAVVPIKNKKDYFSSKPTRFYTTARCVPQKGIDTIIRALATIHTSKIFFDVIGDGEFRDEYEKLAKSLLGNRHQFRIMGWQQDINYEQLAKYDLFVAASREEGLSLSLLEAATLGMPIICSNASGNSELMEICDCGKLFKIDDYWSLAQYIIEFMDNPSQLIAKAVTGSRKVDQHFDLKENMKKIEHIYSSIVPL